MKTIHAFLRCLLLVSALLLFIGCEGGGSGGGSGSGADSGGGDDGAVRQGIHVAVGDGITAGSSPTIGLPWPARLEGLLGLPVINRGAPGTRSEYGAATVNYVMRTEMPEFYLILYGTNDLGARHDPSDAISDLRFMVQAAKAAGAIPILGTLPPVFDLPTLVRDQFPVLNDGIRDLAASEEIQLADVAAAFGGKRSLVMSDGLHPEPDGQELIAVTFLDAIVRAKP